MKNGWGWMAGIGAAGLLVAGGPAYAGGDKAGSTGSSAATQSERDATLGGSGGSMGSTGSAESTPGSAGTTDPSMGSMGSSSGSAEHHATMGSTSQNQVTGKVDKIDKSNNELTLSLKVSDSTQVTKDGQRASLNDIKEGDQIRASFSGSGESLQVTEIEVMSGSSTGTSSDLGTGTSSPSGSSGSTGLETPPSSGSTGTSSDTPPSDSSKSGSSGSRGY